MRRRARPAGDPAGYMFDAQGAQHVVYRGSDDHIHELFWARERLASDDLTDATGAAAAAGIQRATCSTPRWSQHVVYRGTDDHIHELCWDRNGWHRNDLTDATGAPMAAGDPAGYMFDAQGSQHVVLSRSDDHIHELCWDGNGWHRNDLTDATGAPAAGDPAGYMFDAQGSQHVVYRGATTHPRAVLGGRRLASDDLTDATGAPARRGSGRLHVRRPGVPACGLSGFRRPHPRAVVGLRAAAGITATSAMPPAHPQRPGGIRRATCFDAPGTQHVVYRGTDNHIHELWLAEGGGWHHSDLSNATGAPAAAGDPAGYMFDAQGRATCGLPGHRQPHPRVIERGLTRW